MGSKATIKRTSKHLMVEIQKGGATEAEIESIQKNLFQVDENDGYGDDPPDDVAAESDTACIAAMLAAGRAAADSSSSVGNDANTASTPSTLPNTSLEDFVGGLSATPEVSEVTETDSEQENVDDESIKMGNQENDNDADDESENSIDLGDPTLTNSITKQAVDDRHPSDGDAVARAEETINLDNCDFPASSEDAVTHDDNAQQDRVARLADASDQTPSDLPSGADAATDEDRSLPTEQVFNKSLTQILRKASGSSSEGFISDLDEFENMLSNDFISNGGDHRSSEKDGRHTDVEVPDGSSQSSIVPAGATATNDGIRHDYIDHSRSPEYSAIAHGENETGGIVKAQPSEVLSTARGLISPDIELVNTIARQQTSLQELERKLQMAEKAAENRMRVIEDQHRREIRALKSELVEGDDGQATFELSGPDVRSKHQGADNAFSTGSIIVQEMQDSNGDNSCTDRSFDDRVPKVAAEATPASEPELCISRPARLAKTSGKKPASKACAVM